MGPTFIHGSKPAVADYVHQSSERLSPAFWFALLLIPLAFVAGLIAGTFEKEKSAATPPPNLNAPITAEEIRNRR
ncbi:hypothetical protein OKA05_02120 [Luteolibacter arcticus]|uniref:Uncharacterized protein n=1 Tax=Luteolibacter arcticus TaxID=1581411 RepID=A0ABT3GCI4_9BACT|nr:hypothetical protein [Luteolibacter arcticus]MCW1921329.1 hypothetical protein [Luteolibacter arcticus]